MQGAEAKSSPARNLGFIKIRRGLLDHFSNMSSNAVKLYLWFHLKARWKGPKRGTVETSYSTIAGELGWTLKMVKRTVAELKSKGYIHVHPANNQHECTVIAIANYDGHGGMPAEDAHVPSNRFTGDTSVHSFVPSSVPSSVPSNTSSALNGKEIAAPKNAVECSRMQKKRTAQCAVRSLTATADSCSAGKSFKKKKKGLKAQLAQTLRDSERGDEPLSEMVKVWEREGWPEWVQEAVNIFEAVRWPLQEQILNPCVGCNFVYAAVEVCEENLGRDLPPGILCTKIIDRCRENRFIWPPEFQQHRDGLRAQEQLANAQAV